MSRNVAGRGSEGWSGAHHRLRATFQPDLGTEMRILVLAFVLGHRLATRAFLLSFSQGSNELY